jgi:uncharacterized Zn finger protein (UPF0148 family)
MKTATYRLLDGSDHVVEYDPTAPCWMCGEPVVEASMGGTVVCPWCDCGVKRDGSKWTLQECFDAHARMGEESKRREATAE